MSISINFGDSSIVVVVPLFVTLVMSTLYFFNFYIYFLLLFNFRSFVLETTMSEWVYDLIFVCCNCKNKKASSNKSPIQYWKKLLKNHIPYDIPTGGSVWWFWLVFNWHLNSDEFFISCFSVRSDGRRRRRMRTALNYLHGKWIYTLAGVQANKKGPSNK